MTTHLRITIDRGPDAKRKECGTCEKRVELLDYWESRDIYCECRQFDVSLKPGRSNWMRCKRCLAAEREAESPALRVTAENSGGE